MTRPLRSLLLLSLALVATACGTSRTVNLHMRGEADLHQNSNGDPTPVLVWVLQVKEAGAFEAAEFLALTDDPKKVLGEGCILVDEVEITNGMQTAKVVPVQVADTTKFPNIGLVGQFREKRGENWRVLMVLSDTDSDPGIILSGYGMKVVGQEEAEAATEEGGPSLEDAEMPDGEMPDGEAPKVEAPEVPTGIGSGGGGS